MRGGPIALEGPGLWPQTTPMDMSLIDWIGVAGSLVIAGAYLAVSRGWVDPRAPRYHLLNLFGALMILASL